MKISLKYNRRNNIFFLVILIIATVLFFEAHYKWWVLAGFLVLYYLIRSLEIELNDKLPWVWMLMMFAGGATLTMYSIQYLLLDAEDFISESYIFEVSSPGLGRPLKKEKDYIRNMGKEVEIRTYRAINRSKEFYGILKEYDKDSVTIVDENEEIQTFQKSEIALIRQAVRF